MATGIYSPGENVVESSSKVTLSHNIHPLIVSDTRIIKYGW